MIGKEEGNLANLTFAKTYGTVTRDWEKNWPIADWRVPSNNPRNNCGTHFGSRSLVVSKVVNGQTGRFTDWVNGMKNSGLVNFIPEYGFTVCFTNQFHLPKNGREGLKLVSKIRFNKCNTNVRFEYFVRKNRTTFSDVPLLPEIFQ